MDTSAMLPPVAVTDLLNVEAVEDAQRYARKSLTLDSVEAQFSRAAGSDEWVPIVLRTEDDASRLMALVQSSHSTRLFARPVAADATYEVSPEEEEDVSLPHPSVLFRVVSGLAATELRHLNLSDSHLAGEGFKALLQVLRDGIPPLEELLLERVGMDRQQAAEVAVACGDSKLRILSLAGNKLPPDAALPLARLLRKSKTLMSLDVSGNAMRSKGVLALIVAVRDREIYELRQADTETAVVKVDGTNVVVSFNKGVGGGALSEVKSTMVLEEQFSNAVALDPLETTQRRFVLTVNDNQLSANETCILLMSELRDARVVGVPETKASFTGPDEPSVLTGVKEPDPREVRIAMKQKVEQALVRAPTIQVPAATGGASQQQQQQQQHQHSGGVTLVSLEESLMLAQVMLQARKPAVHLLFFKGAKHNFRMELLEAFLEGSSDNDTLQSISLENSGIGKKEMSAIAKAINWTRPLLIRDLNLSCCNLEVEGARVLGAALKQNSTITTIDVSNNSFGPDGCKAVLEALRGHPIIQSCIMNNNLMRSEGATAVRDLLAESKTLRRLDLQNNKLGAKGASYVANALKVSTGLHRMDLSGNGVKTAGMIDLLAALVENHTLFRLFLSGNGVEKALVEQALCDVFTHNKNLLVLDLTNTGIEITPRIEEALAQSPSIRTLGKVTSPGAQQIFQRNLASRIELEKAVEAGDIPLVRDLLKRAPLGFFERKTLLHHAVIGGSAVMRVLLDTPVIATQVNSRDAQRQTALHEAALHNNTHAAQQLLQAGAISSLRDIHGMTPYDLATDPNFRKLMKAEEEFVQAFRARTVEAVSHSSDYYASISGIKSPLQSWMSDRVVEKGSRFSNTTEPSHPFHYVVDKEAPPEHRGSRLSHSALQWCRDAVIFCVLIAWMYELLEIPFRFGFAPNPLPGGYWACALFFDIFFMAWFFWTVAGHRQPWDPDADASEFAWLWSPKESVSSEEEREAHRRDVKSRRAARRAKFIRSKTFIVMLLAAIPWDFVLFIIWCASPANVINPIVLDVIQGLRLMRCGVVFISQNHFLIVAGALNLSWSVLEMCKMALWFFYLLNMFSCIYFFEGRIALRYNYPSWLTIATFLDIPAGALPTSSPAAQYQFTMYFVTFGITNNPLPQNNWLEAFLWCVEFIGLGLVFVAFVFGTIIDRIGELRELRAEGQACQDKIVEICGDLDLPDKIERKIVRKWLSMGSHGMSMQFDSVGEMIAPLSKDLRKEVTLYLFMGWINTWRDEREEQQKSIDQNLLEEELDKLNISQYRHQVQLPAPFPFTSFWHSALRKWTFHPERTLPLLCKVASRVERKFYLSETQIYDYEDPSGSIFMVLEGTVALRLGRVRTGRESIEARLGTGEWFGWEALDVRKKKDGKKTGKPPRRTQAKAEGNVELYVVHVSKLRSLDSNELQDLEDSWLANMDAEVLAWTLYHFPPKRLDENQLVTALEDPLERAQMKRVLINSLLHRGDPDKDVKKSPAAAIKAVSAEVTELRRETMSELEQLRSQNVLLKESLQKSMATMIEMLQGLQARVNPQNQQQQQQQQQQDQGKDKK